MKELIFTAHGTCELRNGKKVLWASDGDDKFAEENQNEFLEPGEDGDEDMIIDYLVEKDLINDNEEIDIVEETLDDEDSDYEDEDDD